MQRRENPGRNALVLGLMGKYDDQSTTMGDMRRIATALESYAIDATRYPGMKASSDLEFDALARLLVPTYAKQVPHRDAWGNSFVMVSTAREYTITSFAADGRSDRDAPHHVEPNGGTTDFAADLIFATGGFTQFPQYMLLY